MGRQHHHRRAGLCRGTGRERRRRVHDPHRGPQPLFHHGQPAAAAGIFKHRVPQRFPQVLQTEHHASESGLQPVRGLRQRPGQDHGPAVPGRRGFSGEDSGSVRGSSALQRLLHDAERPRALREEQPPGEAVLRPCRCRAGGGVLPKDEVLHLLPDGAGGSTEPSGEKAGGRGDRRRYGDRADGGPLPLRAWQRTDLAQRQGLHRRPDQGGRCAPLESGPQRPDPVVRQPGARRQGDGVYGEGSGGQPGYSPDAFQPVWCGIRQPAAPGQGRPGAGYGTLCVLEQPYLRHQGRKVRQQEKDLVSQRRGRMDRGGPGLPEADAAETERPPAHVQDDPEVGLLRASVRTG